MQSPRTLLPQAPLPPLRESNVRVGATSSSVRRAGYMCGRPVCAWGKMECHCALFCGLPRRCVSISIGGEVSDATLMTNCDGGCLWVPESLSFITLGQGKYDGATPYNRTERSSVRGELVYLLSFSNNHWGHDVCCEESEGGGRRCRRIGELRAIFRIISLVLS